MHEATHGDKEGQNQLFLGVEGPQGPPRLALGVSGRQPQPPPPPTFTWRQIDENAQGQLFGLNLERLCMQKRRFLKCPIQMNLSEKHFSHGSVF